MPSAGKRVRASRDWFKFCFWLVEKVARKANPKQTYYFRHSIENRFIVMWRDSSAMIWMTNITDLFQERTILSSLLY